MKQYLYWLSIITCAVGLSACSLPMVTPPKAGCVFPLERPCEDKCTIDKIQRELNDLRCEYEAGHPYAAVCLGHRYLRGGPCFPRDLNKAYCWYKRAADAGIAVAEVQMGHFYRDGCCVVSRDASEAIRWYRCAADRGEIIGMLALGEIYKGWYGTKPNNEQALFWYAQAMKCGSVEGEYQMAWLLTRHGRSGRLNQGINMLQQLAERCHPEAMSALGDLYFEGRLGCRDIQKAYEYYCRSAKLGSRYAMFKLGILYDTGQWIVADHQEALKWFNYAAERELPEAQKYLGDLYRDGRGVVKNYHQAVHWYSKAAAQGFLAAELELADLYHAGKGVPRHLAEAARRYQLAADCGRFAYAELMMSVLYEEGRGVPQDLMKSAYYYKKASHQSDFKLAQYQIGRRYAMGVGLSRNMHQAMRWYYRAAEGGLALAEAELGDLFYSGECVPKDLGKAYFWYQKAAKRKHAYSQNMLGLILLEGDCLPQYAKTSIPGAKHSGHRTSSGCSQCLKTTCICVPAYSEQPSASCICPCISTCAQQRVKCLKCPDNNCTCGPRYTHRVSDWCRNACGVNPYCLAGKCKCSVSQHNATQAFNWIRKAACRGEKQAQFQLGVLYMQGIGVAKNDPEAYAWIYLGLEGMEDKTPDIIRCLLDRMSPEAKRKAACLVEKYRCLCTKSMQYPTR